MKKLTSFLLITSILCGESALNFVYAGKEEPTEGVEKRTAPRSSLPIANPDDFTDLERKEALAFFEKSIQMNPDASWDDYSHVALTALLVEEYGKALGYYQKANEMKPNESDTLDSIELCTLMAELQNKNHKGREDIFQEWIQIMNTTPDRARAERIADVVLSKTTLIGITRSDPLAVAADRILRNKASLPSSKPASSPSTSSSSSSFNTVADMIESIFTPKKKAMRALRAGADDQVPHSSSGTNDKKEMKKSKGKKKAKTEAKENKNENLQPEVLEKELTPFERIQKTYMEASLLPPAQKLAAYSDLYVRLKGLTNLSPDEGQEVVKVWIKTLAYLAKEEKDARVKKEVVTTLIEGWNNSYSQYVPKGTLKETYVKLIMALIWKDRNKETATEVLKLHQMYLDDVEMKTVKEGFLDEDVKIIAQALHMLGYYKESQPYVRFLRKSKIQEVRKLGESLQREIPKDAKVLGTLGTLLGIDAPPKVAEVPCSATPHSPSEESASSEDSGGASGDSTDSGQSSFKERKKGGNFKDFRAAPTLLKTVVHTTKQFVTKGSSAAIEDLQERYLAWRAEVETKRLARQSQALIEAARSKAEAGQSEGGESRRLERSNSTRNFATQEFTVAYSELKLSSGLKVLKTLSELRVLEDPKDTSVEAIRYRKIVEQLRRNPTENTLGIHYVPTNKCWSADWKEEGELGKGRGRWRLLYKVEGTTVTILGVEDTHKK